MLTARTLHKKSVALALSILAAAIVAPNSAVLAAAGGIQNCTASSSCTIGEFLFDDSSAPISGATCTTSSKYPDHTSFLTAQSLSGGSSDGWYYYEFTAPSTTGLYSTTISCTVSGDTLSIDKSFEVVSASGSSLDANTIASTVWSYSSRTLSSFGSLVNDIWNTATRTLSTNVASQDSVTDVRNKITNLSNKVDTMSFLSDATKKLLEQIVNKPVITNSIEDTSKPVSEKLDNTQTIASSLFANDQYLVTQSASLVASWNISSKSDISNAIAGISKVVGSSKDTLSSNTMYGQSKWIKDSWNWSEGNSAYAKLNLISTAVSNLRAAPDINDAKNLVNQALALETIIGKTTDTSKSSSLFGEIKTTTDLASNLTNKSNEINTVLVAYTKTKDSKSAIASIGSLQKDVLAMTTIPNSENSLQKANQSISNSITNNLLGLKGIIDSNLKLLSLDSGKTLLNTWLEVGSIIFKTVATNPSSSISQNVDIKYYLPNEIKKEDIIKTDDGLTVNYDEAKDQLYVEGTYTLAANETKTVSVETKDIWIYSQTVLDSLKSQAEQLSKPLQNTSYYAQGISLRTDIDATVDQIANLQANTVTPDDKIKAYRESVILKQSVDEKLTGMKNLVSSAGSNNNILGFVGGAQTIAVWGIILIVGVAFVLITIYMRTLINKTNQPVLEEENSEKPKKVVHHKVALPKLALILIAFGTLTALGSAFVVNNVVTKNYEKKLSVLGASVTNTVEEPQVQAPIASPEPAIGTGGQYLILVSDTPTGFLRVRETPSGKELTEVKAGDKLIYLDEQSGWFKVQLEDSTVGWVSGQFSSKI
ncbi:hypothetical protein BH10PAT1_BH10PAT1_1140 [soil metagenome]